MNIPPPMTPPGTAPLDPDSKEWLKQARKYISKYAPSTQRIFIRDTKPGRTWTRWVLPLAFAAIGAIFIWGGNLNMGWSSRLNGPEGARGNFAIERLSSYRNKNGHVTVTPVITVQGEQITVKGAGEPKEDSKYMPGDTIDVYYTTSGEPLAHVPAADGGPIKATTGIGLMITGFIVIAGAAYFGVRFRGQADSSYVERALIELKAGRPLPQ